MGEFSNSPSCLLLDKVGQQRARIFPEHFDSALIAVVHAELLLALAHGELAGGVNGLSKNCHGLAPFDYCRVAPCALLLTLILYRGGFV